MFECVPGEKVLVAGDMRELGMKSGGFHQRLEYAANSGIGRLYAIGEKSHHWFKRCILVLNTFE